MPLYLVETISMFRMRYLVDTSCAEFANDAVIMSEGDEIAQRHLDEVITTTREVTLEEAVRLAKEDNQYISEATVKSLIL